MNHFSYRDGRLCAEDVDLTALADAVGTPFYCYSTATIERHYRVFADAFPKGALIAFAVKANGNLAVLRTLAKLGAGADVVSGGELKKALAAGVPADKIVFSGVGKTKAEMQLGLDAGIYQFNVESEPELEALNEVAGAAAKRAPVSIRVNPDVDAKTHAKISTGHAETKFGIPWNQAHQAYALAARLKNIEITGVDVHIGSQITQLEPFEAAFLRVVELVGALRGAGHAISRIDLGGGLGVPYRSDNEPPPEPAAYGAMAAKLTKGLNVQLILEPGRLITANAGILVTRVIYLKKGERKQFLIVDAGMNDLLRPALYEAHHDIIPVREARPNDPRERYDVVGPVCETSDLFAADRDMPRLKDGDLAAILTAGAYGAVMSSAYNVRPPAPEVLVKGDEWAVVRPRMDDDALLATDRIPRWLEA
ncbi:MAG: diaminopimelate decarboxylase [Alphaproteobacteria bacterium]|nr:diaminopimelate decarboxylase [Alphaproteobacteria bacterium]MDE2109799.1 diaminopimelate decarboxylase [Alphaproteobacteria bacterium]MDE2495686.1 diaminopimelate decarboxylase [Alphaproteobacteria bacterium]